MLLKNIKSCFCCQKLLILSTTQENQRHKWKLGYGTMGCHIVLPICCYRGPPPICCQYIISLKSLTWQHMWGSKSVLILYRKIPHFENFRNFSFWKLIFHRIIEECPWCYKWCRKQYSIIVAGFNKNVVFRQQMLFFHSNLDFYLNECT